jgi:hypothetical protein
MDKTDKILITLFVISIIIAGFIFKKEVELNNETKLNIINLENEIIQLKSYKDSIEVVKFNTLLQFKKDSIMIDSLNKVTLNLNNKLYNQKIKNNEKIHYINSLGNDSILMLFNTIYGK